MKGAVERGGHFWPLRALYHVGIGLIEYNITGEVRMT